MSVDLDGALEVTLPVAGVMALASTSLVVLLGMTVRAVISLWHLGGAGSAR